MCAATPTPDRPAVLGPDGVLRYAELERRVDAAARRLAVRGVAEGDRVGLWLPNGEALIVLLLAVVRVGAVACPLSTRWPAGVVPERLAQIRARRLIAMGGPTAADIDVFEPTALLEATDPPPVELPHWRLDRPATIVFTSGSTGSPRAALHTLGAHVYSARGSNANIPLRPDDRWLLALPLYHVGGLAIVARCLLAGACIALPAPGEPLGAAVQRTGATHVSLVATQLRRLLHEAGDPAAGLQAILLGGSAIPAGLIREAHARGWPLHVSYGSTEMASQITTTGPGAELDTLLDTSGRLLPHRELRIGANDEILVRGTTRFLGYVDGDHLIEPFDPEGWFATGDLGRLDTDGGLRVRGRRDRMFISGGENIHPEAIERALTELPNVEQAAVVPVADMEFGFRPVAFVQSAGAFTPEAWQTTLERRLPRFMIPRRMLPWPEEMRGMKVDRARLQRLAERLGLPP